MPETITFNAPTQTMIVGTRRWPARLVAHESSPTHNMGRDHGWADTMEVRIHRVHFENGWTVSVIWGSMTYSDNYGHPAGDYRFDALTRPKAVFVETPVTVEAAVFHDSEDRSELVGGEPFGYLVAAELNLLLDLVAALHSGDNPTWDDLDPRKTTLLAELEAAAFNGEEPDEIQDHDQR